MTIQRPKKRQQPSEAHNIQILSVVTQLQKKKPGAYGAKSRQGGESIPPAPTRGPKPPLPHLPLQCVTASSLCSSLERRMDEMLMVAWL